MFVLTRLKKCSYITASARKARKGKPAQEETRGAVYHYIIIFYHPEDDKIREFIIYITTT